MLRMIGAHSTAELKSQPVSMQNIGFVFPGQGSQSVGMLADLATVYPQIKTTFDEASDVFGRDLWALCQEGPEDDLAQTELTQPIMLIAGVALYRAWESVTDIRPSIMAGHSLGEYTAYVCAGSLTLADGVALVKTRGELMRDACPNGQGGMAAILGLSDNDVIECCASASENEVVQAVNFNAPGQIVIAGHKTAIERAIAACKDKGARKAMALAVSVPCHSTLMQSASEELAEKLNSLPFNAPQIPVINNVDAKIATDPEVIKAKLIEQLYSPVHWVASVQSMRDHNIDTLIECGPGKVLCGMNKRIDKAFALHSLQNQDSFAATLSTLQSIVTD